MRKLLVSRDNAMGLIDPEESDTVDEIGIFSAEFSHQLIEFCTAVQKVCDGTVVGSFKIASITTKSGDRVLALRPSKMDGTAWYVLAGRVEA